MTELERKVLEAPTEEELMAALKEYLACEVQRIMAEGGEDDVRASIYAASYSGTDGKTA